MISVQSSCLCHGALRHAQMLGDNIQLQLEHPAAYMHLQNGHGQLVSNRGAMMCNDLQVLDY